MWIIYATDRKLRALVANPYDYKLFYRAITSFTSHPLISSLPDLLQAVAQSCREHLLFCISGCFLALF